MTCTASRAEDDGADDDGTIQWRPTVGWLLFYSGLAAIRRCTFTYSFTDRSNAAAWRRGGREYHTCSPHRFLEALTHLYAYMQARKHASTQAHKHTRVTQRVACCRTAQQSTAHARTGNIHMYMFMFMFMSLYRHWVQHCWHWPTVQRWRAQKCMKLKCVQCRKLRSVHPGVVQLS